MVSFYLPVDWFYVLESNSRLQTNDEENRKTHQKSLHKEEKNDRDSVHIFGGNVPDENKFSLSVGLLCNCFLTSKSIRKQSLVRNNYKIQ